MRERGREVVMIGHAGHPEVEGTMGQSDGGIHLVESVADAEALHANDAASLAYVSADHAVDRTTRRRSSTRSSGDSRASSAQRADDICYADQNLAGRRKSCWRRRYDLGHRRRQPEQLNSNRLREVAAKHATPVP